MSHQNNNQKKAAEIEAVYNEYVNEIEKLRAQQNKIISDFIKKLEERKIEKIRAIIAAQNNK